MGNVLVSLDDEVERKLRRLAREDYGGKKGALSEAVTRGVLALDAQRERRRWAAEALELARNSGWSMNLKPGEKVYESRDELYD